jgi:ribosomal protein S18 acetylase RimI-like enzyme
VSGHIEVCAARDSDRSWIAARLRERWGSTEIISRGRLLDAGDLPALVARRAGHAVGLATLDFGAQDCELVTLDAFPERSGVGSVLLGAVADQARRRKCRRLWLVTSNDNLSALAFYQRRGLRLVAVYPNAIDVARAQKPSIPRTGHAAIPIHDEIELELRLDV